MVARYFVLKLGDKSTFLVFEDADLESAVDRLVYDTVKIFIGDKRVNPEVTIYCLY